MVGPDIRWTHTCTCKPCCLVPMQCGSPHVIVNKHESHAYRAMQFDTVGIVVLHECSIGCGAACDMTAVETRMLPCFVTIADKKSNSIMLPKTSNIVSNLLQYINAADLLAPQSQLCIPPSECYVSMRRPDGLAANEVPRVPNKARINAVCRNAMKSANNATYL